MYTEGHLDDFEIPEAFVTKEVPLKLAQLRERWGVTWYSMLNGQQEGAGDLNVIPVMISPLWAEKFAHVQTTGAHANRPFRR